MSAIVQNARKLPGLVVGTSLQAARLPLTALARATGQQGNEDWPPAVAFETAEAAVETTLGGLLRDDALVSRGRLRQARVTKLKEAAQLEAVAEQERRQADAQLQERRESVDRQREQIEETAEQREERLEQEAAQRKQQVSQSAAQRKSAAAKQAAKTREVVERQERSAKLDTAAAESEALRKQRAALAAEDKAVMLDKRIDASREARASS